MKTSTLVASLVSLAWPGLAAAQPFMMSPPAQLSTDLYASNLAISNAVLDRSRKNAGRSADLAAPSAPASEAAFSSFFAAASGSEVAAIEDRLQFRPDRKQRKAAVAAMKQRISAQSPQDADALPRNLFSLMSGALDPFGLSVNDLGDTTAVYLIELWDAANGRSTELDRRTAQALADQMTEAYAVVARDEAGFSDRDLVQEQSDLFLLQAYLITSLKKTYQQAGADPEAAAQFQSVMRDLGREVFGIDLARATIDHRGLTPGEALGALSEASATNRAAREDASVALDAPCGLSASDETERKVIALFAARGLCDRYDPARYDAFEAEVPAEQRYAVNFMAWSTGTPLYPADQAEIMDGMIE